MAESIFDTNSITTIEELEKVSEDLYSDTITVPAGTTSDEWKGILGTKGITEVVDSEGNKYYIRIVNTNDNPTGGVKYSNQMVEIKNLNGDLYEITNKGGLIGTAIRGYDMFSALSEVGTRYIFNSVANGMGLALNYDDPNFREFFTDLSDSITDGLFDGNTLPILYKVGEDGIKGYIDGQTYQQIVQYMIDNHIATVVEYEDMESYNPREHTLRVNRGGDVQAMIGQVIASFYLKSPMNKIGLMPTYGALKNAIDNRMTLIKATCQSVHNVVPNTWHIEIANSPNKNSIGITVEGYYISNSFVFTNTDRDYFSTRDIPSTSGLKYSFTGYWRFGLEQGWDEGGAIWYGADEIAINDNTTVYPVPRTEEHPYGIAGFYERRIDNPPINDSYTAGASNFNADYGTNEIPPNIPVTRLPNAPFIMKGKEPPTPQDYIKVIDPVEEPIENDDPIDPTPSNPVTYYQIPISDDDTKTIINNDNRTINNYYYYYTTPNVSDVGDVVPPQKSVVTGESNDLYTIYNPSLDEIKAFGSWLWSSNVIEILKTIFQNPLDGVLSLQIIYGTPSVGDRKLIKCGYLTCPTAGASEGGVKVVNDQYIEVDCGTKGLYEFFGDARDYAPYTEVQIFLPFIGFMPLDIYEVMASTMQVKYLIDVLTGTCVASIIVTKDGVSKVLYTYNGNCAVQLPLSSADKSALITGALGGAVRGGDFGARVGGMEGAIGGAIVGGLVGGFTSGISINKSGNMSGNAGALGIKKPYLVVKRYRNHSAANYNEIMGRADNTRCLIGEMSGFSQFTALRLNIRNATEMEIKEIETLLHEGIFV